MNIIKKNFINTIGPLIFSIIGVVLLIVYIFKSSIDIPVSDYMRIINYYLEDVTDLHYLFSTECIVRVPITFLFRYINVKIFHYSVFFDRIVGIIGIGFFNFIICKYAYKLFDKNIFKIISYFVISLLSFSLMSWEMILNGTGYPHLLTMGFIVLTYYLFDNIVINDDLKSQKKYFKILCFLIPITCLLFAGSYAVSFVCVLVLFCAIYYIVSIVKTKKGDKSLFIIAIISTICLLLYFISNSIGEPLVPVGITEIGLVEAITKDLTYPIRFLIKSLASSIIGYENFKFAIEHNNMPEILPMIYGSIYLAIIFITMIVTFVKKYFSKYSFLMMMALTGIANYGLIFLARYKFLRDDYGTSSRYSIQYIFLTIAVVLILLKFIEEIIYSRTENNEKVFYIKKFLKSFVAFSVSLASLIVILSGHLLTDYDEIIKMPLRTIAYVTAFEATKTLDEFDEETIGNLFEYKRGKNQIIRAFKILEDNNLSIYHK